MKYRILGHANAALSIILDSLYSIHGPKAKVEIISNIKENENEFRDMAYIHPEIETNEFFYEEWQVNYDFPFLLAGMSPRTKKIIFNFFQEHFNITPEMYTSVIHQDTILCNGVTVGNGCNISPRTTVAPFTSLGNFVTLNRHVSVGHHTKIGDFSSINPGCHIAGLCNIGKGVQIGMGATIIDRIEIGDNAIIGAGSLVTKPVPANTLVYGSPAKVIKVLN